MRKFKKLLLILLCAIPFIQYSIFGTYGINPQEETKQLLPCYLLMNAETHTVLEELNGYEKVPVGTMSKLMTILLAAESVNEGKFTLDTMLTVSSNVNLTGGAVVWLTQGEQMSVRDLLKSVIIGNANDASITLAEAVSGAEQNFVMDMNARAFELNMRNTIFCSASGFDSNDSSSAYDLALLCSELSKHDFLKEYMTCWMDKVRNGETEVVNENKLVRTYDNMIGFKAGHSEQAGNCLAVGAEKNNSVYIAVVLGYPDKDQRFSLGKSLLDKGFANYKVTDPVFSTEHLMPLKVSGGVDSAVQIEARELKSIIVSKTNADNISSVIFLPEYITAPVKKNQIVGTVGFYVDDTLLYETDLVTTNSVDAMTVSKAFKLIWTKLLK